jgi:hypothetical protein
MTRVRIRHIVSRKEVGDVGTFKQLYEKYGLEKTEYWCGDIPPEENGTVGYRLDPAERTVLGNHMKLHGHKKAWVDLELSKALGKRIILVWNAGPIVKGMCDECPDCLIDGCDFHEDVFDPADKEDIRIDDDVVAR